MLHLKEGYIRYLKIEVCCDAFKERSEQQGKIFPKIVSAEITKLCLKTKNLLID